jgi:lactate permease
LIALLALMPCAAVLVAVLFLRASVLTAALLALASALALWGLGLFSPPTLDQLDRALADAFVLELLVGVVIFFGLLFAEAVRRAGTLQSIGDTIQALELSTPKAVILIAMGIGVALESLTGYGVSMLVTMPLLLALVPRKNAMFLALLGMSLMTWGALSIAALLGAKLAGLAPHHMAQTLVTTSGPVAALLPLACLAVTPAAQTRDALFALGASVALCLGIWATSRLVGMELAGVGGGLAVILLTFLLAGSRALPAGKAIGAAAIPFAMLVAVVVAQKVLAPHLAAAGITAELATPRVTFDLFTSPGLAFLIVVLVMFGLGFGNTRTQEFGQIILHVAQRSWRALTAVMLFLITARLLVETGGIGALSEHLAQLGVTTSVFAVVLLGGFGAYATGSGVTSNALFMSGAAETGRVFDAPELFAALQHSGASHAAMASLPVIALLLAALPSKEPDDTQNAMRTGLILAGLWVAVVALSGLVQVQALR